MQIEPRFDRDRETNAKRISTRYKAAHLTSSVRNEFKVALEAMGWLATMRHRLEPPCGKPDTLHMPHDVTGHAACGGQYTARLK